MSKPRYSVAKSAALMGLGTFFSRILGLVREQVFAYFFGAGHFTDAFQIAFRIPNLLRDLFAEGAMSAALVPTFTEAIVKEGEEKAWRVAGLVFRILFTGMFFISVIGFFYSDSLVTLYAPSFSQVPGKHEITVKMTQIMMGFFPLIALAAAFMGVLNARGVFFIPAFASAVFNFFSISVGVVFIFLAPSLKMEPIVGMAIGVVVGALAQAACQWPSLRREGFRWVKGTVSWFKEPYLKKMFLLMIPGFVGLSATQVSIFVNSVLATGLGAGAVSWLAYASRLIQFPMGIFGVSFAQATLPVFSSLWSQGKIQDSGNELLKSMGKVTVITIFATAALCSLSVPMIRVIYEHGAFKARDSHATAIALAGYVLALPSSALVRMVAPICYAMGRTRIAVLCSVLSMAFGILFNILVGQNFGYLGLAIGASLSSWLNLLLLLYWVAQDFNERGIKLAWSIWILRMFKGIFAATCTALVGYTAWKILDGQWLGLFSLPSSWIGDAFNLFVLLMLFLFTALIMSKLLRLNEVTDFINNAKSRILKKINKTA